MNQSRSRIVPFILVVLSLLAFFLAAGCSEEYWHSKTPSAATFEPATAPAGAH